MSGMPIAVTGNPKLRVIPRTPGGTLVASVTLAAAKSGNNPGCMDSTPTEAEVVALQTTLLLDASAAVKELDVIFSLVPSNTSAVQCVLVRINGFDDYEDAAELALQADCDVALANVPLRIVSPVAITRLTLVGVQSGVASGVYTGARVFIRGRG